MMNYCKKGWLREKIKVIAKRMALLIIFLLVAPLDLIVDTLKEIRRAYRNWSWHKHKRTIASFSEEWKEIGE